MVASKIVLRFVILALSFIPALVCQIFVKSNHLICRYCTLCYGYVSLVMQYILMLRFIVYYVRNARGLGSEVLDPID